MGEKCDILGTFVTFSKNVIIRPGRHSTGIAHPKPPKRKIAQSVTFFPFALRPVPPLSVRHGAQMGHAPIGNQQLSPNHCHGPYNLILTT